jgi:hypothetical protein
LDGRNEHHIETHSLMIYFIYTLSGNLYLMDVYVYIRFIFIFLLKYFTLPLSSLRYYYYYYFTFINIYFTAFSQQLVVSAQQIERTPSVSRPS